MSGEQIALAIGLIAIAGATGYALGFVSGQADKAHEMAEFVLAQRESAEAAPNAIQNNEGNTNV